MTVIEAVRVDDLSRVLGFADPIHFPEKWRTLPLRDWCMDADDVILRYVFRHFRPRRHLEFGTWLGDGVLRCVEECDASVWTINVLEGESRPNGEWAYGIRVDEAPHESIEWAESRVTQAGVWIRTDAYGRIGRNYLDAGWGKRVCQIYSDSREWDDRSYPRGFFDTAFIDGGHVLDVVANDTMRAIALVRPGGLVIWHDFCPSTDVTSVCESTRDVVDFVNSRREGLAQWFDKLFWVEPSWLLFGIRSHVQRVSATDRRTDAPA